ncbi:GDP-L-fucose synthase family protein [Permianibacter aggregans]|uniref:GDP-L-fucose synthase n=1 Tax=Permianibacter aggregans TaxID=1510150 RepID=A0A4R6UYH2_9GAMM|nr:GDP-L-fucose synthase [Permianibacter aggregans]QGX41333.1 GDP-L-fucose synthase [Permianibacter aggregans]TDQ51119.1 GDP-L-fucose synthase [Permianibacter aggregans]
MKDQKVLCTGATGFLGRHVVSALQERYGESNVVSVSSKDYNLLNFSDCQKMLVDTNPGIVVHLAAYSGGIGANRKYPADFFFKNSLFVTNMFEAAARFGLKKLVYTMGGCSYPAKATSPIDESQMWNGYPQQESAGYSVAKKMGIVASESYRQQYGLNSVVLIPGNLYGEYDNFRTEESHVVPAMVRRYFETKQRGEKSITMWGDGSPVRDFAYAGDVAKLIPWFLENYDSSEPVNISSGTETSIRYLAETIKEKMGWDGTIEWDTSKPNGQMVKIFDVKRLNALGLSCDTPLSEGLDRTIKWFEKNYAAASDGLRL